ncbi:ATP-binding protein [Paenibacillus athensensis]|uniref:ATP-binding protein n=1 Tax=Paenibacillus athensensis TaxID=1967502 RepID=A0A4Y8PTA3_9BACL|nr:ATP-binding protein [Paenibacillus athensensis]MCD1261994.1 ATP-binding protein [Paenibacillus athensensis]
MEFNDNEINAEPTKEFFINMLVKDIPLINAIQDLIDNCVDGAIKLRPVGDYSDLYIKLTADSEKFEIEDNCGGFSAHIARNYAFRFGRPEDAPDLPHSVGRFGVGMKRALFKMGKLICIKSICDESKFKLDINIDDWKRKKEWTLEFSELEESKQLQPFGTFIRVSNLNENAAEQFSSSPFITNLIKEVKTSHETVIEKGLQIYINGILLEHVPVELYFSDELKPAYVEEEVNGVNMRIYTGMTKRGTPQEAGWYIYCNGRLLVEADKSELTGWGNGHSLFHNTFAMFRGYIFFDAIKSELLPWNTTKNGIDSDSKLFRYAQQKMLNMMRPVTDFLKKIKDNPYGDDEDSEYEIEMNYTEKLDKMRTQRISTIDITTLKSVFQAPKLKIVRKPLTQKIQYNKPIEEIEKVRSSLNATSLKDLGEKTFEYFYRMECK